MLYPLTLTEWQMDCLSSQNGFSDPLYFLNNEQIDALITFERREERGKAWKIF